MKTRILRIAIAILTFCLVSTLQLFAQTRSDVGAKYAVGTVYGNDGTVKVPLSIATVTWKGTKKGTYSDSQGRFKILREDGVDSLEVRYAGYISQSFVPSSDSVVITLDPISAEVVQVFGEETTITSATQKTEKISSRDLSKSACCSLAESFEKSPSVEVSFSDAVSGARQIQLLGLRGLYTQFLIDAVPLIRSVELPFGLDHIPGPFMESVSISKGASTVTQGYEGMSGQINICYKTPSSTPTLHVNAYGNSMGRAELNIVSAQRITDVLSVSNMVHGRILEQEIDNNSDGFMDVPNFKQLNFVHHTLFNDDEYEFHFFIRGLVDRYSSGQIDGLKDSVGDPLNRFAISTDIDRLDSYIKFGLLNPIENMDGSGISMIVSGVMHNQESLFGNRVAESRQRTFQAKIIGAFPFNERLKLVTGVSYMLDDVNESISSYHFDRQESVPGVYGELTMIPVDQLTVIAGVRADWNSVYGDFFTPRLHAKWAISPFVTFRGSVGKGYRAPTVVAENISSFINSRQIYFDNAFRAEESWNYGASLTASAEIFDRVFTLDLELYQTTFQNQVVVDYDRNVREVWITNLYGNSFATHAMAQALFSPIPRLDLLLAYRWVDVQAPYNDQPQQRPMVSRNRLLITASYATLSSDWQFDATISRNGAGRLPSTSPNPPEFQRQDTFPGFWRINAQVTKKFDALEFYVGGENLTGFIQQDPIVAAGQPFSQYFDASMAWGPTDPLMIYFGVRYTIL